MSIFGYGGNGNGDSETEIVRCIFLDKAYPHHYQKQISELEATEKELSETTGLEPVVVNKSYKEGGLAWNYAIIAKINHESEEAFDTVYENPDGEIVVNEPGIYGSYQQFIPKHIQGNSLGFAHIIRGGADYKHRNNNSVAIIQYIPGTLPEKDWNTGFTADQITEENKFEHTELFVKERMRVTEWERVLERWEKLTEDKAIDKLEDMISRRLLLFNMHDSDSVVKYVKPRKGLIFTAKLTRKGIYTELSGFEWNKENSAYDYHSNGVELPCEEEIELADKLIVHRNNMTYINKISAGKEELAGVIDDDPPF